MNNLKTYLSNIKSYLVLILAATVGVLVWLFNIKNKELEANKAKIDLVQDQKEADALESQINQKLAEEQLNEKDRSTLQQSLSLLDQKRNNLKDPRTTDQEKEGYWDKK